MCMIDGCDEYYDSWSVKSVKARKPHVCKECGREIAIGETYTRESYLIRGDGWGSVPHCSHCDVACQWLRAECGGWLTHGVYEDIAEHAYEYDRHPARYALYRLKAGMRRKWKRFDGAGLLPIPRMPALSVPPENRDVFVEV